VATSPEPAASVETEASHSPSRPAAVDARKRVEAPDSTAISVDAPESDDTGPSDETKAEADGPGDPKAAKSSHGSLSPSAPRSPAPFRLLLPTTAGVLLVDLEITLGDQPLSQAFDRRIESVLEAAAEGEALTWRHLREHIESNPQLFGNTGLESQSVRDLERVYDRNRNRRPDPEEAASLIFRNGRYAGPFRLVGSNHYRQTNRSRSPLFAAMDDNADGVLNEEEIERADQALRRLDLNGDRRLDFAEIDPSSNQRPADRPWNRRVSRWGDVAMDLGGFVDWSMVAYALEDASQQGIFQNGPSVIARIDENRDQAITENEARRLLEVDADLFLRVRFDSPSSAKPQIVADVIGSDPVTEVQTDETQDRIQIGSDQFRLMVTAVDRSGAQNAMPPEVFDQLDADDDGELDENEIPDGALREYSFNDLDQDDSGRLSYRELAEGMASPEPIWTVQVRSRGAEVPDAIMTWLDQNQDGALSTRELVASRQRLDDLRGKEASIAANDFPDTFLVQFVRGDPRQDDQLFAMTPASPTRAGGWPLWARSMDANQDGDIARSEFLGNSEQFNGLDRDGDGFLEGAEISGH
jgi:Ca2+-binding EF-hand superfamily protein